MEHYPEDHHKKPKAEEVKTTEENLEPKEISQVLQKSINEDLEFLKEELEQLEKTHTPESRDHAIELLSRLHSTISIDQGLHIHLQNQIDLLRTYEDWFNEINPNN